MAAGAQTALDTGGGGATLQAFNGVTPSIGVAEGEMGPGVGVATGKKNL